MIKTLKMRIRKADDTAIRQVVHDSMVITVPIDDTLSVSGTAADALAVGNALATKANASEIKQALSVNGRTGGGTYNITVNGSDIPASGDEDQETVAEALERLDTALGAEETARQTADTALGTRIDGLATRIGAEETARADADTALGTRIDGLTTRIGAEETARADADTALGTRIDGTEGRLDTLEAHKGIVVYVPFTTAATINVANTLITAAHYLTGVTFVDSNGNLTDNILADFQWNTTDGNLEVVIGTVYAAGTMILDFGWRQRISGPSAS